MREPLNQAFYKTLAIYRNLKECKSKHFFEIGNKFIKSYHFIYRFFKGIFLRKPFAILGINGQ